MGLFSTIGNFIPIPGASLVGELIDSGLGLAKDVAPIAQAVGGIQDSANSARAIEMQLQGSRETNQTNIQLAQENRDWNSIEAEKNREFQRIQTGNAHQREVADLMGAGLNPILSATGGSGSASGSGSMATSQAAHIENPYEGYAGNVNAARQQKQLAYQTAANLSSTTADVNRKEAETKLLKEQKVHEAEKIQNTKDERQIINSTNNKLQQERLTEVEKTRQAAVQTELFEAQRRERLEAAGLNSAQRLKEIQQGKHLKLDYDIRNPYIESVTGPAKKIGEAGGSLLDAVPWKPKTGNKFVPYIYPRR